MKRMLMYLLILLQIVYVLTLVFIFENAEKNGTEITILTKKGNGSDYMYDSFQDLYVTYEINEIHKDYWEKDTEIDYNKTVYIVLKKNELGIDEVKYVSLKKQKSVSDEETVLAAQYNYRDNVGSHHVRYGFEWLENADQFGSFSNKDQLKVTFLVGKFGQRKLVNIEKMTD